MPDQAARQRITEELQSNRVVLFMKGTALEPRCGFSARVGSILRELGIDYRDIDVLSEDGIREEIKAYSEWPTIPQLYIDGRFIGGCDIVSDLYESGELHQLLGLERPKAMERPSVRITERAAEEVRKAAGPELQKLRFDIGPAGEYDLYFDQAKPGDVEVSDRGIEMLISRPNASRVDGLTIDFVEDELKSGFRIERAPQTSSASGDAEQ